MRAYAALDDRLLAVGTSVTERLVGRRLEAVAATPAHPGRALVGTADGLARTTDGGASWEWHLSGRRVTAVTVSPHDPDVAWAGTEPSAVYRSGDGGATWTERPGLTDLASSERWSFPPRPDTHHVRWIAEAPADPGRLYVAIEAGALVRSPDGGETWVDHPAGARWDNHTLGTHPEAPDRVYAAAGDGYAESTDGGDTWTHPQAGLEERYVWGLAVGEDPGDVVVSAATGPRAAHDPDGRSRVYRRVADQDGDDWRPAMDGLPGPEGWARPVLAHRGRFYALSNHGLHHSEAGMAWEPVDLAWRDAFREQVPRGLAVVSPGTR